MSVAPPDFIFAKACFIVSALILFLKVAHWIATEETDRKARMILSFFIFGIIGVSLVEALNWVSNREKSTPQEQSKVQNVEVANRIEPTLAPEPQPSRLEMKVDGESAPFVSEMSFNNETFKAFLAQVDNPFPNSGIKLKLVIMETPQERAEFPFPDYQRTWPFAWATDTLPNAASPKVFKEIVLQSKSDKQKIIFCLPTEGKQTEPGKKGLWCRLVASNEPSEKPFRGEIGFWLWIDENGDLRLK